MLPYAQAGMTLEVYIYIYIYLPPLIMVDLGSTDWISEKTVRQKAVFKGYRVTVP